MNWRQLFRQATTETSSPVLNVQIQFPRSPGRYRLVLLSIASFFALLWLVVPGSYFADHWRALVLALTFGATVGFVEVASRYRDDPLLAVGSPFGVLYVFLNGAVSLGCALLVFRFKKSFPGIGDDELLTAITAGFGSSVLMRARLAIVKDPDNKDVSIGPDVVIKALLLICDVAIDRYRAQKREQLVLGYLPCMRKIGEAFPTVVNSRFANAANYMIVSLFALQNPDAELRGKLEAAAKSNDQEKNLPEDFRFLAFGYLFLNLVGETLFESVLRDAKEASAIKAFASSETPAGGHASVSPPPVPSAAPPAPSAPQNPGPG